MFVDCPMEHSTCTLRIALLAAAALSASLAGAAEASPGTQVLVVGGGEDGDPAPVAQALLRSVETSSGAGLVVVFTGNYLARGELPSDSSKHRDAAETGFDAYLEVANSIRARGGQVFFLPGHRDYARKGRKGPRRLRKFLENELLGDDADEEDDDAVSVVPVADCAEPVVVELEDGVTVLAFVNSQWWMQDFTSDAKANQGCELKRRSQLGLAFEGVVKKYRTKRLIILSHHPIRSQGPFGGRIPAVDYVWPPVAGLFGVLGRTAGLVPQYASHPLYSSYIDTVHGSADKFGKIIFASGHDRSLQILNKDDQLQIVSGAGSAKTSHVGSPAEANEHTASVPGWAIITVAPDGEGQVALMEAGEAGASKLLFQRKLPALPRFEAESPEPAPLPTGPVESKYTRTSFGTTNFLEAFFLGRHYRDAYDLDLSFEPLILEQRGFTPIRVGGGAQTNSLRLVDPEGGQWSLRATTKDSSRFLPYPLGKIDFVRVVVDDAFTANHPGAALAVPPLAEAVGIYHTRPRLLFVPDQRALEPYRGYMSDEVALLERRPEELDEGTLPDHLGGRAGTKPVKYDSSTKVLEKLRDKPWKYSVDQENMLRARLLDMVIGDWDRHEDQWRWVRLTDEDGEKVFRPIPRDRDQAFAHYDGFVLALGRLAAPEIRVLGTFDDDIGDPTWLNYGARHIDSHFLNGLDRERWMAVAEEVKASLTDEIIAEAMTRFDPKAYALDGEIVARKLRNRRDKLIPAAEKFYEQLSEKVVVVGSDKKDLVYVRFEPEGPVQVEFRRGKKGPDAKPYYSRRFDPADTKEVHLYALAGKDEFVVFGEPHGKIRVRILGGRKKDLIRSEGSRHERVSAGNSISIYDLPNGLTVDPSIAVDDQRSTDAYRNQYDRKDPHYEPDKFGFIPGLLINPDDGVYLGGQLQTSHPGFKRSPFDVQHTFSAYFATATLGVVGGYDGLIPNSLFGLDQRLGLSGTTPQFTRNFFGITNDFVDPSMDRDVFRLRQSRVQLYYGPSETLDGGLWELGFHLEGYFINTENTAGRNIATLAAQDASLARALTDRYFVGGTAWLRLDSRDSPSFPERGVFGELFASGRVDLTEDGMTRNYDTHGLFGASVGGVFAFDRTARLVLSTRAQAQAIMGDYLFYWAPTLGANQLRAYNQEQLAGAITFSHSTDLRLDVIRISGGLPGSIGLAAAFDHGRVFDDSITSNTYHLSTGGTVYWNIAGLAGIGFSYHVGFDDPANQQRFMFLVGPLFSETGFRN